MKHQMMATLAAAVFVLGLAVASPAQARGGTISDEEAGMVCDDSTIGYYVDIDFYLYFCDGRNWVMSGTI
jgi:hypothetical protein